MCSKTIWVKLNACQISKTLMVHKNPFFPSYCLSKHGHSCTLQRKGMHFFIYALHATNVRPHQHEIPCQYKDYNDVFEKKNVDTLPKHQPYDCTIDFLKKVQPHLDPSTICHKLNLELFVNTSIRISRKGSFGIPKSSTNAPILFVKNKDGSLWMRGLNWFTIKNRYPLPLISRLLDQLIHAKVYTKINLCGAYNLMCIQEGDEWKIALCTHYGHFE